MLHRLLKHATEFCDVHTYWCKDSGVERRHRKRNLCSVFNWWHHTEVYAIVTNFCLATLYVAPWPVRKTYDELSLVGAFSFNLLSLQLPCSEPNISLARLQFCPDGKSWPYCAAKSVSGSWWSFQNVSAKWPSGIFVWVSHWFWEQVCKLGWTVKRFVSLFINLIVTHLCQFTLWA